MSENSIGAAFALMMAFLTGYVIYNLLEEQDVLVQVAGAIVSGIAMVMWLISLLED